MNKHYYFKNNILEHTLTKKVKSKNLEKSKDLINKST